MLHVGRQINTKCIPLIKNKPAKITYTHCDILNPRTIFRRLHYNSIRIIPCPTLVYARTEMRYSTFACKFVRSVIRSVIFTVSSLVAVSDGNANKYLTSYIVMTPFWSIGGTSSHITVILVAEVTMALTLVGADAGAI